MNRSGGAGLALRRGAGLAALLFLAGCAKEEAPPGALPDTRPPQVSLVEPGNDSIVPGFDGDLHIGFDEPIKPPQDLSRTLLGSPAYRYEVGSGFSDLKIHPDGGWRAGAVYVIEIPAGIPDLLGNRTASPIRVVFSTGPPITDTRTAGTLLDRVTGRGVQGARVLFEHPPDTIPYSAVSDTGGTFALSSLPTGHYRAYGFRDLNGDMRLQRRLEPYDSAAFDLPDSTSSVDLTLRLTEPDSTPPRLLVATALDSLTVELRFDDYLDPDQPFDSVRVAIRDTLTGASWPVSGVGPETVGGGRSAAGGREPSAGGVPADAARPAAADTTGRSPADTAGSAAEPTHPASADTAGRPARDTTAPVSLDTTRARAAGTGPPRGTPAAADTSVLPVQKLLARLGRPLAPGAYRVTVEAVRNLRDLSGGGDTLLVYPTSDTAGRVGGGR
ncbi:MAG: Ig-like domain-containing protein [Candidatus Palauibacterales bacterium]|nr:Ig-like domain-containing protein [Candidatus Palauibacterales bacterium]MDP2582967.1 Ig-like domain-containing protein [Candidatus Palauibacterales bacterium]